MHEPGGGSLGVRTLIWHAIIHEDPGFQPIFPPFINPYDAVYV